MYNRTSYTIVGIFVITFSIGLIGFALWLGKYNGTNSFDRYLIVASDSISGLSKNSVVKLHGVNIGRIDDIEIDPKDISKINIYISISKGTPIKKDMVAETKMLGVTGLLFIEISGGTNSSSTLKGTGSIPTIPMKTSLISRATNDIENISVQLTDLLYRGQKLLSNDNIKHINLIIANLDEIMQHSRQMPTKVNTLLTNASDSIVTLNDATIDMKDKFSSIVKNSIALEKVTKPMIKQASKSISSFNKMVKNLNITIKRGDYNLKRILEPILTDIEVMSEQVNDLSRQMQRSPNDIIFKSRKSRKGPGE